MESEESETESHEVQAEVNGKKFTVKLRLPKGSISTQSAQAPQAQKRARAQSSSHRGASGAGSGKVTVPMQGTVVKVLVSVGQNVEIGEAVIVLEAMKMENSILAEKAGVIKELKVKPGDTVGSGDIVAVIE